jgi:hypothetical protein
MFWLSYCDFCEVVSEFLPVCYVCQFAMHSRYSFAYYSIVQEYRCNNCTSVCIQI